MEWPKSDEKLFVSADDWPLNACVNCYRPDIGQTADHYNVSAKALARAAAEGDVVLDQAIIAIAFLYRQYIELSLKQIIDTARRIENQGDGYPQHHNLQNLWAEVKRLLIVHYGEKAPPEVENVQACINEFHSHDPNSMSFRYPTDRDGNPTLRGIVHINLRNLYETMERLASFFDCLNPDLGVKLEWMNERMAEYATECHY